MSVAFTPDAHVMSAGLLILRLTLGLVIIGHGVQKLLGWFGGPGLAGAGGYFESLGFHPGRFFATTASLAELASGVLVALGLFGPLGPALLLAVMIVAAVSVHWHNGLFATNNGIELALLYAAGAVALALTGPGLYSLDAALGLSEMHDPRLEVAALIGGIAVGVVNLLARRRPMPAPRSA